MKRLSLLLAGLLLLGIAASLLFSSCTTKKPAGGGATFNWILNDLQRGKELAAKENKLILADFWADW